MVIPVALAALLTTISCGSSASSPAASSGSPGSVTTEQVQTPASAPEHSSVASSSVAEPAGVPADTATDAKNDTVEAKEPARPVPETAPEPAGPGGRLAGLLAAHNELRQKHCAPPLRWSAKVAAAAQKWANTLRDKGCRFGHDNRTSYGENLAFFRPTGRVDGAGAVAGWYQEIDSYDFKKPGFSMETGHFTQLVWTATTELGCGVVSCGGGEIWVCRYNPPGNYRGQYRQHVLPTGCKQ